MHYISTVTYTVWMILVPKEQACSKLHDGYHYSIRIFCSVIIKKGKRSVLELRANPVQWIRESYVMSDKRPDEVDMNDIDIELPCGW